MLLYIKKYIATGCSPLETILLLFETIFNISENKRDISDSVFRTPDIIMQLVIENNGDISSKKDTALNVFLNS